MRHLDDDQITAAVAELELEAWAEEHLASCLSCRQQVHDMRELIDMRRDRLTKEAPDWQRQRQEILLQLPSTVVARPRRNPRWLRPMLAAAAVLLVTVGLGLMRLTAGGGGSEAPELAVEQILAEVDAVLADEAIPGFESIDPGMDDLEKLFSNGAS